MSTAGERHEGFARLQEGIEDHPRHPHPLIRYARGGAIRQRLVRRGGQRGHRSKKASASASSVTARGAWRRRYPREASPALTSAATSLSRLLAMNHRPRWSPLKMPKLCGIGAPVAAAEPGVRRDEEAGPGHVEDVDVESRRPPLPGFIQLRIDQYPARLGVFPDFAQDVVLEVRRVEPGAESPDGLVRGCASRAASPAAATRSDGRRRPGAGQDGRPTSHSGRPSRTWRRSSMRSTERMCDSKRRSGAISTP